jgi:hypothetical protein
MSSDVVHAFRAVVNMTAEEIEAWLQTAESRSVGLVRPGERESVGRQAGRRIVAILRRSEPLAEDHPHMRKVVGFVRRHRAQRPRAPERSRWRYSLMNWGHDPLKADLPLGD